MFEPDRPLVVQFGGSNLADLAASCRLVEALDCCDAVELNVGCPQRCARRANYGAFLLSDPELLKGLVRGMVTATALPVSPT